MTRSRIEAFAPLAGRKGEGIPLFAKRLLITSLAPDIGNQRKYELGHFH